MSIRDEVRASAAAHHDLGPGYDTAVAEGLVERIGEEIDRRVDARLFGHLQAPAPARPRRVRDPGRLGGGGVFLAPGSRRPPLPPAATRHLVAAATRCTVRTWAATTRRRSAPRWARTRTWDPVTTTRWPKGWSNGSARRSTSGSRRS